MNDYCEAYADRRYQCGKCDCTHVTDSLGQRLFADRVERGDFSWRPDWGPWRAHKKQADGIEAVAPKGTLGEAYAEAIRATGKWDEMKDGIPPPRRLAACVVEGEFAMRHRGCGDWKVNTKSGHSLFVFLDENGAPWLWLGLRFCRWAEWFDTPPNFVAAFGRRGYSG